jgi:hypothetical protein
LRISKPQGGESGLRDFSLLIFGGYSMNNIDFQMVCDDCGSLAIRIENPENALREEIVHCGDCGAERGTMGALRDLASRQNAQAVPPARQLRKAKFSSELVALHNELQSLRRKVETAESSWRRKPPPDMLKN